MQDKIINKLKNWTKGKTIFKMRHSKFLMIYDGYEIVDGTVKIKGKTFPRLLTPQRTETNRVTESRDVRKQEMEFDGTNPYADKFCIVKKTNGGQNKFFSDKTPRPFSGNLGHTILFTEDEAKKSFDGLKSKDNIKIVTLEKARNLYRGRRR